VLVSLALVIVAAALDCYEGECIIAWASKAARVSPKVAVGLPEIQQKVISAEGNLE
jgi:hypothetical protein